MHVGKLGDIIREKRITDGFSQEELCHGICTVRALSSIENNLRVPAKFTLATLMQRMGMPDERYYSLTGEQDFVVEELRYRITQFIVANDYEKALEQISILENVELDEEDNLTKQFIMRSRAIVGRDNMKSPVYTNVKRIKLLTKAIKMTVPSFNIESLENTLLSNEEMRIILNIAFYYILDKQTEIGIKIYSKLLESISKRYLNVKETSKLIPTIALNLSSELGNIGEYSEAIKVSSYGIKYAVENGNTFYLGELTANKAEALLRNGDKKEALKYMLQAYYVLSAMDRTNLVAIIEKTLLDDYNYIVKAN